MAEPTVRGSFVWHDLMTSDVPAAVTYYQKVNGWKTQPFDANYLMWVAKTGPLGGVEALPAGQTTPYWLPYVGTTDIGATLKLAEKLGGKIVKPVTEIASGGSYAVLADPQGAIFGVHWGPNSKPAAGMPQVGQFSWQELATSDYQAAFAFYQALFGWQKVGEHDMGAMGMYFMYGLNGQPFGGMFTIMPGMPMPPAWCCYAQVADARKTAKVAVKAGGKLINGPMQVPGGSWIAQLIDPQGGMHAVVSFDPLMGIAPTVSEPAATPTTPVKKAAKKKVTKKKIAKKSSKKKAANKLAGKSVPKKKVVVKKAKKKAVKKKTSVKKSKRPVKAKVAKKKSAKRKK
jgi:predicted enzyme related to lactoylglutathione lyase